MLNQKSKNQKNVLYANESGEQESWKREKAGDGEDIR